MPYREVEQDLVPDSALARIIPGSDTLSLPGHLETIEKLCLNLLVESTDRSLAESLHE